MFPEEVCSRGCRYRGKRERLNCSPGPQTQVPLPSTPFLACCTVLLALSLVAQLVKNHPAMQETPVLASSWVWQIRWRRDRLPTPMFLGFLCGSTGKESACNSGDLGLLPGLGRSPGEGKGYPLQYSGLENSMDCTDVGSQRVRQD